MCLKPISFILVFLVEIYFVYSRNFPKQVWTTARLVNGSTRYEGRVEVKVNGTWGTVCDDRWSYFDGYVLCRQLGFDGVSSVLRGSSFGPGSGPIFHDDLKCTSRETDLSQCPGTHDPDKTDCTHAEDAGVRCQPPVVKSYPPRCHSRQFECTKVQKCVPRRWLCDGHDDCGDNSDEIQHCFRFYGSELWDAMSDSRIVTPEQVEQQHHCGTQPIKPVATRIVGGKDARPGSWPWMTSIRASFPSGMPDRTLCGATLINANWVLTAAHCFDMYKLSSSNFHVLLGDYNQKAHDAREQKINISHVYIHDQYRPGHHDNDIALIRLEHAAHVGHHGVSYACLPMPEKIEFGPDDVCFVTGWGQTHDAGSNTILQQAQVPIIENSVCNSWYVNNTITDKMLCAGYQYGGIDACKGDSGGPLSCKKHNHWYVAGIVSWGNGCAQAQQPGVYVNVLRYYDWISSVFKTRAAESSVTVDASTFVGKK